MTARFDSADIRAFYGRHTRAFLRYGQGGGGSALQRCLARGCVGYDFTVFRRTRT